MRDQPERAPDTGFGRQLTPAPGGQTHAPPEEPRTVPQVARSNPIEATVGIPGYRLLKLLGRGGMGEVYLAERVSSAGVAVRCVVKTILADKMQNAQLQGLFLDEARIIAQLRHPNVVSVLDVGEANGGMYLAMELIDGLDASELLGACMKRGRDIPLKHFLYVMREVLQGLHHAHTAVDNWGQPLNIVHRDISPGNILISRHGAVKLADFGVALGTAAQTEGSASMVAGKPHYFAPEIWTGTTASVQTDIFAMGVTFWELLTGKPLFDRKLSFYQVAGVARGFHPDKLLEENLTVPDLLEPIVLRCLNPDPNERYKTALEFLEDINDFCYETGIRLLDAHFARFIEKVLAGPLDKRDPGEQLTGRTAPDT